MSATRQEAFARLARLGAKRQAWNNHMEQERQRMMAEASMGPEEQENNPQNWALKGASIGGSIMPGWGHLAGAVGGLAIGGVKEYQDTGDLGHSMNRTLNPWEQTKDLGSALDPKTPEGLANMRLAARSGASLYKHASAEPGFGDEWAAEGNRMADLERRAGVMPGYKPSSGAEAAALRTTNQMGSNAGNIGYGYSGDGGTYGANLGEYTLTLDDENF